MSDSLNYINDLRNRIVRMLELSNVSVAETIGGVSPVAWVADNSQGTNEFEYPVELTILIDTALEDYDVLWAAAGHTHAVFPTTFSQLIQLTEARPLKVSTD